MAKAINAEFSDDDDDEDDNKSNWDDEEKVIYKTMVLDKLIERIFGHQTNVYNIKIRDDTDEKNYFIKCF